MGYVLDCLPLCSLWGTNVWDKNPAHAQTQTRQWMGQTKPMNGALAQTQASPQIHYMMRYFLGSKDAKDSYWQRSGACMMYILCMWMRTRAHPHCFVKQPRKQTWNQQTKKSSSNAQVPDPYCYADFASSTDVTELSAEALLQLAMEAFDIVGCSPGVWLSYSSVGVMLSNLLTRDAALAELTMHGSPLYILLNIC